MVRAKTARISCHFDWIRCNFLSFDIVFIPTADGELNEQIKEILRPRSREDLSQPVSTGNFQLISQLLYGFIYFSGRHVQFVVTFNPFLVTYAGRTARSQGECIRGEPRCRKRILIRGKSTRSYADCIRGESRHRKRIVFEANSAIPSGLTGGNDTAKELGKLLTQNKSACTEISERD